MELLVDWCNLNKLDLNWSKNKVMFVSKQRKFKLIAPSKIIFNGNILEVVDNFKLLEIAIDNNHNFVEYATQIRAKVNTRIHSIKKLF
jgi:hypothetical protein